MRARLVHLLAGLALFTAALSVAPAFAAANSSVLSANETLTPGDQLASPRGTYLLRMQTDGNLVLYGPSGAIWSSRTGTPGTRLVMQTDGNLVAYTAGNTVVWHAGTQGDPGARLVLQDDGNAVVYSTTDRPRWASASSQVTGVAAQLTAGGSLGVGGRLQSPNGRQSLVMQSDGNLVLYGPTGALWASRTGVPGTTLLMQTDGNLVAYSPGGAPVWHTHTGGNPGARVVVQDDGNLVVYRPDGRPPWYRGSPLDRVDVGGSGQVVRVSVPDAAASSGQLTAWELTPGGWSVAAGPVVARVGSAGVGVAREGTARTPAGTFTLTEAFGRLSNPGTALPYRVIDDQDWWVSDVVSTLYNQHTRCAIGSCPFSEAAGENLYAQGGVYDHAVVIDYNRSGVRGAGSAFFLHVSNGAATAGCVAIDRQALVAVLRWLSPAATPVIAIGVA